MVRQERRLDGNRRRRGAAPERVHALEQEVGKALSHPLPLATRVPPVLAVGAVVRGVADTLDEEETAMIDREVHAFDAVHTPVPLSLSTGIHELGRAELPKDWARLDTPVKRANVSH